MGPAHRSQPQLDFFSNLIYYAKDMFNYNSRGNVGSSIDMGSGARLINTGDRLLGRQLSTLSPTNRFLLPITYNRCSRPSSYNHGSISSSAMSFSRNNGISSSYSYHQDTSTLPYSSGNSSPNITKLKPYSSNDRINRNASSFVQQSCTPASRFAPPLSTFSSLGSSYAPRRSASCASGLALGSYSSSTKRCSIGGNGGSSLLLHHPYHLRTLPAHASPLAMSRSVGNSPPDSPASPPHKEIGFAKEDKAQKTDTKSNLKYEIPSPKIPTARNSAFSQLERMIKLTNFDQKQFQSQVRTAVARQSEDSDSDKKAPKTNVDKYRYSHKSDTDDNPYSKSRSCSASPHASEGKVVQSKSMSPLVLGEQQRQDNNDTLKAKTRTTRRTRTVENLMGELQRQRNEDVLQQQDINTACEDLHKDRSNLRPPPLLLVTRPSMGGGDDEEEEVVAQDAVEASAAATLKLATDGSEEGSNDYTDSYDEDEDYTDEDEEYSDEEEWESDWDVDEATVSRTLQLSGHESDFEFPFELGGTSAAEKGGNRIPANNALPPPIFTASICYDGMSDSWGGRSYSDEGTGSSLTGPSGDEVEVGFTLVQRAAMRGSDEEFSTTSGSYTSGSYTSGSSFDEDESYDESSDLSGEEERDDLRRPSPVVEEEEKEAHLCSHRSSSPFSSSSGESAQSVRSGDGKEDSPKLSTKTPQMIILAATEQEEPELHMEEPTEVQLGRKDEERMEAEEVEECEVEDKEIVRIATFVREQELQNGNESTKPIYGETKPRTDFAKKAVVQSMKPEKLQVTEQKTMVAPGERKIREEEERKKRTEEENRKKEEAEKKKRENEENVKRKGEEKNQKSSLPLEKRNWMEEEKRQKEVVTWKAITTPQEDKSAQRKSMLNMSEAERVKAEKAEKEATKQRTYGTGAVSQMTELFKPVIPDEPLTYKRSSRLEPKVDEQRQKRVFAPIPKPELSDDFDKQMSELREQMRQGSQKLQSEFRDISQGLKSASGEAKLKAMDEAHKSVLGKATSAFGRAEEEKQRQRELKENDEQRAKREHGEKERRESERKEKEKALATAAKPAEPKRTVRRAAKEVVTNKEEEEKKEGGTTAKVTSGKKGYWERGTRRKTEELMKFTIPPADVQKTVLKEQTKPANGPQQTQPKKDVKERRKQCRRRSRKGHPRRPFTRAPFDIDDLLGWRALNTFEKMDTFFMSKGTEKRPVSSTNNGPAPKRRGTEGQKIWISELRDIDRLYKASELRDIKLSAGA